MGNQKKKLQEAARRFRRENPRKCAIYRLAISSLARALKTANVTEGSIFFNENSGAIYGAYSKDGGAIRLFA